MNPTISRSLGAWCLFFSCVTMGCQPAAKPVQEQGHEHEHEVAHSQQAKSLPQAITQLKGIRDQIRTAMESEDLDAAHDPLHEVGTLLEAIPQLAADTDLPEKEWGEIKQEVDRLFAAFGEIDEAFHDEAGDKKAAYERVKTTIDESIAAVEAKLPISGDGTSASTEIHVHPENENGVDHK